MLGRGLPGGGEISARQAAIRRWRRMLSVLTKYALSIEKPALESQVPFAASETSRVCPGAGVPTRSTAKAAADSSPQLLQLKNWQLHLRFCILRLGHFGQTTMRRVF